MGVITDRFAEQLAELERKQEEDRLRLERFLKRMKKTVDELKNLDD
jgi:hypothetical protein